MAPRLTSGTQTGHVSQTIHFDTYQPLRNRNLMVPSVAASTTDEIGSSSTMNTSWMKKTQRPTPIGMEARSFDSVSSSPNMPRFLELFSAYALQLGGRSNIDHNTGNLILGLRDKTAACSRESASMPRKINAHPSYSANLAAVSTLSFLRPHSDNFPR
jgi:hypothetical protein